MTPARKQWIIEYDRTASREAKTLAAQLNLPEIIAILLCTRGFSDPEKARRFLNPGGGYGDPFVLPDMETAVTRIIGALERKEKIAIYGDYDVDGVTSTAALYLYLKNADADVVYHIPSRSAEGYGMNKSAIDALKEQGCALIVTVDTGITAIEEVKYAKSIGLDVVITDHHECHGDLPDAPAVNPKRPDSKYDFSEFAGVGVVFKLLCALEMKRSSLNCEKAADKVMKTYGDLIAVGTIADVMPLVGENRAIVSSGLEMLSAHPRPGFLSLLSMCNTTRVTERISTSTVSFALAPKLNAAGRLADASLAVSLLLSEDSAKSDRLANELLEMNKERQQEENRIFRSAVEIIENDSEMLKNNVIVLAKDGWHHGVIGIVASRLTEKYGLPSILVSFDESGVGKGSGRSVKGLNLARALAECGDCLLKFGGHELAAGLSVDREHFDEFKRKINEYAADHLTEEDKVITVYADCELEASEINESLADSLGMLEPYGTGNSQPIFVLRGASVREASKAGDDKHTKFTFEKDGVILPGIFFNVRASTLDFRCRDRADVMFTPGINDYRGIRTVQLMVQDARLSEDLYEQRCHMRDIYEAVCGGDMAFAQTYGRIVPRHSEFAQVYRALRGSGARGDATHSVSVLGDFLEEDRETAYVRVMFILDILAELKLIEFTYDEYDADAFSFRVIPVKGKTNLDRSEIYKKLKAMKNNG